jgi:hypothetical protein
MNERILKLLYRSFDDLLNSEEKELLKKELRSSKDLRKEKINIETIRTAVSSIAEKSFKPFFTERVMQRIASSREKESQQEIFFKSMCSVFRPVAIGVALLVIALMSYNLIKADTLSLGSAFARPDVTLEEAFDPTLILSME